MSEITMNGNTYFIGKLTPKQQLHLTRRLLPLFVGAAPSLNLNDGLQNKTENNSGNVVDFKDLGPLADAISKMSDSEVDAIIDPCLGVVNRKIGEGWSPIMPSAGKLMYQDISIVEILTLVSHVITENLGNFFLAQTGKGP